MYLILNIIEHVPLLIKTTFLGALIDMCSGEEFYGHYLCTWRSTNKKKGLMSLLATVWREEEKAFEVRRTPEGCVDGKI